MGVRISSGSAAAVSSKPTFESTEEAPAPVKQEPAKKKAKITKPDIDIPPEFEPTPPSGKWFLPSDMPKDRVILAACAYEREADKFFFWRVKFFEGPHGPGWYVCGTQWHSIDLEIVQGWMEDVGHP